MSMPNDEIRKDEEEVARFYDDDDESDDGIEDVHLDPLPNPEEMKPTVNQRNRNSQTGCSDVPTCVLFIILVLTVATFVISFYVGDFWEEEQLASADVDTDKETGTSAATEPTPVPTPSKHPIEVKLRSMVALRGGSEFDDQDSYQSKALRFLLEREDLYGNRSIMRLQQIYALLCFFHGTGAGPSWSSHFHWIDGEDEECLWTGIECDAQDNVFKLELVDGGLNGEIPEELVLLEHLTDLNLEDNPSMYGTIPSFLGTMGLSTYMKSPFPDQVPSCLITETNNNNAHSNFSVWQGHCHFQTVTLKVICRVQSVLTWQRIVDSCWILIVRKFCANHCVAISVTNMNRGLRFGKSAHGAFPRQGFGVVLLTVFFCLGHRLQF